MRKICSKCKKNKPLEEYYNNGKFSECKSCNIVTRKKYRTENKQKISERSKKYYIKNRQRILEYGKKYCIENKQRTLEYGKKYRKENKEKIKVYYTENKDKILEKNKQYRQTEEGKAALQKGYDKYYGSKKYKTKNLKYEKSDKGKLARVKRDHNRRSKEKEMPNNLTPRESTCILFLQSYKCANPNCKHGRFFDGLEPTIDHIVPVDDGGPLIKDNVQYLCRSCNSKKGTKEIDYRTKIHKNIINQI